MIKVEIQKKSIDIAYVRINGVLEGVKIMDYYPRSHNFKRIQKEGVLPLLQENFIISDFWREMVINDYLSLYCLEDERQARYFRIGCFIGHLNLLYDLEREEKRIIFNELHTNNKDQEFKKYLQYVKIIRCYVIKKPLKKRGLLKDKAFFTRIIRGEEWL